jgi:hypothetical protein
VVAAVAVAAVAAGCGARAPECADGASESLRCGLNGRSSQTRSCVRGAWVAAACSDPDVCVDNSSDEVVCGINRRGSAQRHCVHGAWQSPGCDDPDACVDGGSDVAACGLNGRGTQARSCTAGSWSASRCDDPDVCVDHEIQHAACGVLGAQSRQCVLGQWGAYSDCVAPIAIPAPGRRDMVHDARRQRLYITTGDGTGQVLAYDLATRQFEAPLLAGGAFSGIDLSPDQDRLVVADLSSDGVHDWIYRIDLTTGAAAKLSFDLGSSAGGTFTAVFTSNTEALVTSMSRGARRVDLTTGAVLGGSGAGISSMLTASADGSIVASAQPNISSGPIGRYRVTDQRFFTADTNLFVYEIAVSRTGSQLSVPTPRGLLAFTDNFGLLTVIGSEAEFPVGAVYSPVGDELYLAWTGKTRSIDVYSATTLRKLRDIAPLHGLFSDVHGRALQDGRIKLSRDGTLVFATHSGGVLVYPTGL